MTGEYVSDEAEVTFHFMRDAQGHVSELSIGEQRVWDIRFRRVR